MKVVHYTTKDGYTIGDFQLKHLPQLYKIIKKTPNLFNDNQKWITESVTNFSVWWHQTIKESLVVMKDGRVTGCMYMDTLFPNWKGSTHIYFDVAHARNPKRTFEIVHFGLFYIFSKHNLQIVTALIDKSDERRVKFIVRNGYTLDGVVRKHKFRDGEWKDFYLCTITREEYEDIHKIGPRHVDSGSD
jgi:RimJ/RimL family protein N-acetyltransferase